MGTGGGGGSQSAGYQIGSYWSPGGLPTGYKNLLASSGSVGYPAGYLALQLNGSNYSVTSGKTLTVTHLIFSVGMPSPAQNGYVNFGYANDAVGTGFVTQYSFYIPSIAENLSMDLELAYTIPAGKVPLIQNMTNATCVASVIMQGMEQ